jgi:DNA ligase (NAD+)
VTDILLQPDLRRTAREPLNFFCNGLFHTGELQAQLGARTHYEIMLALQGLGLRVNRPHLRVCREIAEVIKYSFELKQDPARFPCEIRGALVTLNPLERIFRPEGATLTPFWVIAFKSCGS